MGKLRLVGQIQPAKLSNLVYQRLVKHMVNSGFIYFITFHALQLIDCNFS